LNESAWIQYVLELERKKRPDTGNFEASHSILGWIGVDKDAIISRAFSSPGR
jgi:hypothetical protein